MNIIRTSENTVLILFEQVIDADNFAVVNQCVYKIKQSLGDAIVDVIVSYASIHITFNLLIVSGVDFIAQLQQLIERVANDAVGDVEESSKRKIIEIPVYYGDEVALDLAFVASKAKLSSRDVIELHTGQTYDVYAIGFAPGFAYLGNVDLRIATARRETPRKKIASGSVGIADQQTAIYPSESPGGWQIVGRTPIQVIDYNNPNLTQFSAGDKVRFYSINKSEYLNLGGTFLDASVSGERI